MLKKLGLPLLALALVLGIGIPAGLWVGSGMRPKKAGTTEPPPPTKMTARDFCLALIRDVRKDAPKTGNFLIFPTNVLQAYAPLAYGSSGELLEEIDAKTGLGDDRSVQPLQSVLRNQGNDKFRVTTATSIWLAKNFRVEDAYVDGILQKFEAEFWPLDYGGQGPAAAVNEWFMRKIELSDVVKDEELRDVRLLVAAATKIDGKWEYAFPPAVPRDFRLSANESIRVPMMEGKRLVRRLKVEGMELIALSAEGNAFLIIGLPDEDKALDDVAPSLTNEMIAQVVAATPTKVRITFPKLKLRNSLDLKSGLMQLGLAPAFSPPTKTPHFGRMSKSAPNLYLGFFKQLAEFEVDEGGFRGKAAAVGGAVERSIDAGLVVNRPCFMVAINKQRLPIVYADVRNPLKQ